MMRSRSSSLAGGAFALCALVAPFAGAQSTGFESLDEGFYGTELTLDGLTFFGAWDGFFPPEDGTWAVDDGTGVWAKNPAMLDFVDGNLLNVNGYSNGADGYAFFRTKALNITAGGVRTSGSLSVAYVVSSRDGDYSNNTITLQALLDDDVVASTSTLADNELGQSSGGTFTFGASRLEIDGVAFDALRMTVTGPTNDGTILGGIDNVVLVPEPATGLALVLGFLAARRPRRT